MSIVGAAEPGAASSRSRREDGRRFTREDLQGQTTVLVFYPFAFSPVCTDQLNLYEEVLDEFKPRRARPSTASRATRRWAQKAFQEKLGVTIEQLSDFEPKGAACRAFGVYHPGGFPQRALVIVGPDGVVHVELSRRPRPRDLPGANLIFDALAAAVARERARQRAAACAARCDDHVRGAG